MCEPASAAFGATQLAISGAALASSVTLGLYTAQQQAQHAQASMDLAVQQQAAANDQFLAQQQFNQSSQYQSLLLSQQQQYDSLELSQRQAQDMYNLSVQQSNQQILENYLYQQDAVEAEQATIMDAYTADKQIYQKSLESAIEQQRLNNEAANRVYMGEQAKIQEARAEAAFEAQNILAKSIGTKGTILASGRSGQSIGLLVTDVERQAGFAKAQELAMAEKKVEAGRIEMESAFLQAQGDNEVATSGVAWNPSMPSLPKMPDTPTFIDGSTFEIT